MFGFLDRWFRREEPGTGYMQGFRGGRVVNRFDVGRYNATLITDLHNSRYAHVMIVDRSDGQAVYVVASEIAGWGASVLGAFDRHGHYTYSFDARWGDLDTFAARATEMVRIRYGGDSTGDCSPSKLIQRAKREGRTELDLSRKRVEQVPEALTQVTRIPVGIGTLHDLVQLELTHNPPDQSLRGAYKEGLPTLRGYLRETERPRSPLRSILTLPKNATGL
jgi:hypothetical protein